MKADWFADYAAVVVAGYQIVSGTWLTFYEPQYSLAWVIRRAPMLPGRTRTCIHHGLTIAHHVLLAHGKAVQAIRSCSKTKPASVPRGTPRSSAYLHQQGMLTYRRHARFSWPSRGKTASTIPGGLTRLSSVATPRRELNVSHKHCLLSAATI